MLFACILIGVTLAGNSLPALFSILLLWPIVCIVARLAAPSGLEQGS